MNLLACDLGGTKVLLGIYKFNKDSLFPKLIVKKRYQSSDWKTFDLLLENFLSDECRNLENPVIACFAIAGVIKDNSAKITNLSWHLSEESLKNKFRFKKVELINDFSVLIYGISNIRKNQFSTIQEGNQIDCDNRYLHAIVGAGTGLGIARGLITSNRVEVFSSEGGHTEFSPRSDHEWELREWIKRFLNIERVSCERLISGEGLYYIAKWRFDKPDLINHPFQSILNKEEKLGTFKKNIPSKICKLSEGGDLLMREILNMWISAYASLIGDIAVHELCFGGLWISGGTAPKHFKNFTKDSFMKHFSNKGRFKDIVKSIPMRVILDEEFGLYSAGCRAQMHLKIE